MIGLGNATTTLTGVLAGAKTSLDAQFTSIFVDERASVNGIGVDVTDKQVGTTNGVAAVTLLSAGPNMQGGYRRKLKFFDLFNIDTGAITITIKIVDTVGAGTSTTLVQFTLQTLEHLFYVEGRGFYAIDANGNEKTTASATSSATSTADSKAVQASSMASIGLNGSSQASSIAAAIVPASINSVSSQASSLAAAVLPASVNSVSSQASSMAALTPASVSSNASLGTLGSSQCSSLFTRWSVTISKTSSSFSF